MEPIQYFLDHIHVNKQKCHMIYMYTANGTTQKKI
jgi:hypothetical protein